MGVGWGANQGGGLSWEFNRLIVQELIINMLVGFQKFFSTDGSSDPVVP